MQETKKPGWTAWKTLMLIAAIVIAAALIWNSEKPERDTADDRFEFTIGPVGGIPRCALIKGPDDTFVTVQADDKIEISMDGSLCTVTDATRDYDYYSYTTGLDKVLIFQTASGSVLESMKNQYGPAQLTCNSPDGKTISGRADKVYIHANGACEFIIGNAWYCTDITNVNIMRNSHETRIA